jgi:hypothetical protein
MRLGGVMTPVDELRLDLTTEEGLVGTVTELTPGDIEAYKEFGPDSWPQVNRISWRHRRMAQLLSLGTPPIKVARTMGCTAATVSRLLQSPAFKEMIAQYQDEAFDDDKAEQSAMTAVFSTGLDVLHERMVARELSDGNVVKVTLGLADRIGHAPVQRTENRNLHGLMSKDEMASMKESARGRDNTRTEKPVSQVIIQQKETGEGAGVGGEDGESAVSSPEVEDAEYRAAAGNRV